MELDERNVGNGSLCRDPADQPGHPGIGSNLVLRRPAASRAAYLSPAFREPNPPDANPGPRSADSRHVFLLSGGSRNFRKREAGQGDGAGDRVPRMKLPSSPSQARSFATFIV